MHKFLRAVGFSKVTTKKKLRDLISYTVHKANEKSYTSGSEEDSMFSEFAMDFGPGFGLAVRGEFDEENHFTYEYYFPFLRGEEISSREDISIERHAQTESYAGICDEVKIGISLIFYVQNAVPYIRAKNAGLLPIRGTTLTLSALALHGKILMPMLHKEPQVVASVEKKEERISLLTQARKGNEEAIETLTLKDMDIYSAISKKVKTTDLYSLVDTTFMPYGVECDQYTILAEILDWKECENHLTGEKVVVMKTSCNDLVFDVCINRNDLEGEPMVHRRFKGVIWLQGKINFPDTCQ